LYLSKIVGSKISLKDEDRVRKRRTAAKTGTVAVYGGLSVCVSSRSFYHSSKEIATSSKTNELVSVTNLMINLK